MHQSEIQFTIPGQNQRVFDVEVCDLLDELESSCLVATDGSTRTWDQRTNTYQHTLIARHTEWSHIEAVRAFCEAHGWTVTRIAE